MQNDREKFKQNFIERLIKFSINIVRFSQAIKYDRKINPIIDQLIRSSTSIGANIVEAKASSSKRDYIKFFEIALKSANETKYWLILLKNLYKNDAEKIDLYIKELEEISKIIGSSVLTLKGKKDAF